MTRQTEASTGSAVDIETEIQASRVDIDEDERLRRGRKILFFLAIIGICVFAAYV